MVQDIIKIAAGIILAGLLMSGALWVAKNCHDLGPFGTYCSKPQVL